MIAKTYACDDCGSKDKFSGYKKARAAGWAVSKDYSKCYCPNCAPNHRRGKASTKTNRTAELPKGFEQLSLGDL